MQLDWKPTWLILGFAAILFGAGCSGINTSQSVSPASFLLPGFFGQATVPSALSSPGGTPAFTAPLSPLLGEPLRSLSSAN